MVNKARNSHNEPVLGAREGKGREDVSSEVSSKPVSRREVPGEPRLAASD